MESNGSEPNPNADIRLPVSVRCCELETEQDLDWVLRYLVKPVDIVEPYETAIAQIDVKDFDEQLQLNQLADQLLNGHLEFTDRRQQMIYVGNLDTRSKAHILAAQQQRYSR